MARAEQDHLAMMRNANRWPVWPLLPLQHRSRKSADGSPFRETGFMFEDGNTGKAKPVVYIGVMYFHLMGLKLEDLPVEQYDSLEAVVAAGWEVN
jgi:hypothetical protein